jgi:hypothetical protein
MKARAALLFPLLMLAGCGERATQNRGAEGSTTPPYVRDDSDPTVLNQLETPVRVGELGPSFAACNAHGAVRQRGPAASLPVRAAPFDAAGEIDRLDPDAEFFVCARSQDESWFGIVYDEGGRATARCGVDAPSPRRRAYLGPCAAGWVPSARVRLRSGVPRPADSAAAAAESGAPKQ